MLFYLVLILGMVTSTYSAALSPQSKQADSGPPPVQADEPAQTASVKDFDGKNETSSTKSEWLFPPIHIAENQRGPYPRHVVKIRTSKAKDMKVFYNLTGPGADQPPIGLFTIDGVTGDLNVTQPLDREEQSMYKLFVHAATEDGALVEEPIEIVVKVIDMNDNKPVFQQELFQGSVQESTPKGAEVLRVVATDADEPYEPNSDIRYRILSQDPPTPPKAFTINPVTGGISLSSDSADRKDISTYTLTVEAADMEGEGLTASSKAIITIEQ